MRKRVDSVFPSGISVSAPETKTGMKTGCILARLRVGIVGRAKKARFARPTIPEEKWGTTRSLILAVQLASSRIACGSFHIISIPFD